MRHTCGNNPEDYPKPPPPQQYIPTREEMMLYLAKLKELMEPKPEPFKPMPHLNILTIEKYHEVLNNLFKMIMEPDED